MPLRLRQAGTDAGKHESDILAIAREIGTRHAVGKPRTTTKVGNDNDPAAGPQILRNGLGVMAFAAALKAMYEEQGTGIRILGKALFVLLLKPPPGRCMAQLHIRTHQLTRVQALGI